MSKLLIISLNGDPVASSGTEHAGGQVKYILELGRYLVRDGWFIDVFTIKNDDRPDLESITEGFQVIRFPLPGNKNYSYQVSDADIDHLQAKIMNYIDRHGLQYDLLLCCYWLSGLTGIFVKEHIQKNMLVSFCSLGYFKRESAITPSDLDSRIRTERFVAEKCDHIIATSAEEKQILVDHYEILAGKISIIPRGVNLDVFYKY